MLEISISLKHSELARFLLENTMYSRKDFYQYLQDIAAQNKPLVFYKSPECPYLTQSKTLDNKLSIRWDDMDYGDGEFYWLEFANNPRYPLESKQHHGGCWDSGDLLTLMKEMLLM